MFVSVKVCDFVCPSKTLPKPKLAGDTLNAGPAPVPVKAIESGELFASLVMVTLPDVLPAPVGVNTALSVVEFPEVTMKGTVIPFTE